MAQQLAETVIRHNYQTLIKTHSLRTLLPWITAYVENIKHFKSCIWETWPLLVSQHISVGRWVACHYSVVRGRRRWLFSISYYDWRLGAGAQLAECCGNDAPCPVLHELGMVAHTGRWRQDGQKFKTLLSYIGSLRRAWSAHDYLFPLKSLCYAMSPFLELL